MEDAERQASAIKGNQNEAVNVVKKKPYFKKKIGEGKPKCYRCGFEGHKADHPKCPAKGQQCRKCKNTGHFESVCKTKQRKFQRATGGKGKHDNVRQVRTENKPSDGTWYAFTVIDKPSDTNDGKITVVVGGVPITMIIDSGATCSVIDRKLWEHLKSNQIQCESKKCSHNLYPYGSKQSLTVAGMFTAKVSVGERAVDNAEFMVIEGEGQALLGRKTAKALGVLKLGPGVNAIQHTGGNNSEQSNILHKYPNCCEGIGKLKDFQLKIPIDHEVEPVAQPMRRVPYHLRDKLSQKLDELVELDIVEKVNGPSSWVSPVVVVPKVSGDIRLCVDMRQANTAVKRERYPIPTIDEVLQDLNQSKFFSKLDLNSSYHQIELAPESRALTTFATHQGLYWYKQLMFGVSCAPEMYQKILQQVLQECEGAHNILDDVVVHVPTEEEHDKRVERVVQVLSERGFTFNCDKCQFKILHLEFMRRVISTWNQASRS